MIGVIEYFFLGILLGFLGVGLPTLRTIKTMEGEFISVFFISLCASASMFLFMNLVVALNYPFMVGNALGAATSVSLIGYKRRKMRKGDKD